MTKDEEIVFYLEKYCNYKLIDDSDTVSLGSIKQAMQEYAQSLLSSKESLIIELTNKVVEQEKEIERLKAIAKKAHWHGWFVRERLDGPDAHGYENMMPENWSEMDYEEHEEWFFNQFAKENNL